MNLTQLFSSSIGKKIVMALTGLFLVTFLVVHCYVNANIFFPNAEENFNRAAHFMGTNLLIRITEIGLFAGFIVHIAQGYQLALKNKASRKSRYAVTAGSKNSKWYSRSAAILGTLILLFLIIHLAHFWVPSRFGGLEEVSYGGEKIHNLYLRMKNIFANPLVVIVYISGCISLSWHLLHGIQSAAQTLGWTNKNFFPMIKNIGVVFSILIPLIFALMPLALYFDIKLNLGNMTLLF